LRFEKAPQRLANQGVTGLSLFQVELLAFLNVNFEVI
jgi:hypothetical protein